MDAIAGELHRSSQVVQNILRTRGVRLRGHTEATRKYHVDELAFERGTPESFYWRGFMLADGCVCHRFGTGGGGIRLTLQEKDDAHVEAFRDFLRSNHPVRTARPAGAYTAGEATTLHISSQRLADSLTRLGVPPRKTLTAAIPQDCADSADFMRGLVDGDGWLTYGRATYRPRRGPGSWTVSLGVCGTRSVCEGFAAFAARRLSPPPAGGGYSVRADKSIWRVVLAGYHALRMADLLYRDPVISLPRKQAVADALASIASNL